MELHNAPASVLGRIARGVFAVLFALAALGGPANAVEVMTATGYQHSAYLADDGTVWCWGKNQYGQLGNNSTTDSNVPIQVRTGAASSQLLTDVIAIAAGYEHTFALRADGTVWSWGRNESWGALGLGSTASSFLFANQISGLSGIKAIAAGGYTGYALSAYGSLHAWGHNGLGSVGDGTVVSRISPVALSITNIREISAGLYHTVAVLTNGTVNSWGHDSSGQLGNGVANDGSFSASPVVVTGLVNALHVACGNNHTLVTRANGQIAAWGLNSSGQLGTGSVAASSNVPVSYFSNSRRVFASGDHSMTQQVWGNFFTCGKNDVGQCARGAALSYISMSSIGSYVRGASGFGDHSLIIGSNGQVWACGGNASGQLGGGSTGGSGTVLTLVTAKWPVSHIVGLSASTYTTHAVKSEGSLSGWGYNADGQVGDGGTSTQTAAVPVSLSNVLKTASGQIGYHALALAWDGKVHAWGSNSQGQLGNGAISNSATSSPALVSGVFSVRDIAAGGSHSLVIDNSGSVYAWGDDSYGQVGDDAAFDDYEANPRAVVYSTGAVLSNIIAIAAGHEHSLALRDDGTVWSWGYNGYGQLGNGGFVAQARAVQVPGLTNIIAIGAGYLTSYAITADGQVMGWGYNSNGQLGNGGTTNQSSPVNARTSIFVQLRGATSVSGGIYHAIANRPGEVLAWGFNAYGQLGNSSNTDQSYATGGTGLTTAARVVAGAYHSHALLANGSVRSWGYNGLGSLGTGDYTATNAPVAAQPNWLPTANLTVTDADAGESGPNAGAFQVTRTGSTAGVLVVGYATAGTASEGSDFTTLPGSVTIAAGQASATVVLMPIDDSEDEVNEIESTTPTITTTLAANQYLTGTASGVINITDNDVAGVTFPAVAGFTNESDGNFVERIFTVRLSSRPTAPVTLTFASSNPGEAAVDTNTSAGNQNQTSITFTTSNWNIARTVHVLGQQDTFDDGDITYSIQTTSVTSADAKYNGLGVSDQSWTNFDDDTANIIVSSISGPVTEAGGVATFTIRLTSEPYDRVDFTLSSNDSSEYQLQSGSEVATLDSSNWSSGVTIAVVGVDDSIDDDNVAFNVQIAKSVSNDPAYDSRGGWDVAGSCTDDDSKGVVLSTTSVSSDEDGTPTGFFTVRLASQPIGAGTVIITFAGDTQAAVDTDAATAGNQTIVSFSSSTWSTPRTVSVPAIDDNLIEVTQTGTITGAVSGANTDYTSPGVTINVPSVICTITDNDAAGFTLSPSTTASSRQNTSEPGVNANFTVRLTSRPASGKTVMVRLRSNDVSEGQLSTTAIVRTSTSTTGGTDTINFASGTDLSAVAIGDRVWITGIGSNSDLQGNVLSVIDAADTIVLSANLLTESGAETITIYPRLALTFTNATWATLQTVTVTGQDDLVTDTFIQQNYQIDFEIDTAGATHDANYIAGLSPTQWMKNLDNDTSGLQILQSSGSTVLTEADIAATDSFLVQLTTSPTSPVTVTITAGSQFSVDRTALFFTAANFNVAQTVTTTVVDDLIDEASTHSANITFATSSSQVAYNLLPIDDIVVAINDNDTAGISVIPTTGLATTEGGGTASFSISLASQPTAPVVLGIASSNSAEGTVSAPTLTFTTTNWFQPQSVVITGIDDPVDDDLIAYTIITSADASTSDANYLGVNPLDVTVNNVDNDSAGVTITASAGSTAISEAGATDTYTVVLNTRPTSTVLVGINPGSQCTVSASTLTFTTLTWDTAQTVIVSAVNDFFAEGAHTGTLTHAAAGGGYGNVIIASLSATITDNDTSGVTVSAAAVTCTEAGGTGTFTVRLDSQPTANVTVVLGTSDATEGTVSPASLTFSPANYATAQSVTVTGVDDFLDDGNIAFAVSFALISADTVYNNFALTSKAVTCTDNDSAGFSISAIGANTTEASGTSSFSVRLTSQPSATITVGITSSDASEGSPNVSSLTFDSTNWNELQYVVVTGVDDSLNDGNVAYSIVLAGDEATSDASYSGGAGPALNPADVAVTTTDDDSAGVAVSTPSVSTRENGSPQTYTAVLQSQPTADVVIAISIADASEATVLPALLTFTASNWNSPQVVTVTPVDDFLADGSVAYTVVLANCVSVDTTGYNNLVVGNVTGTNTDDDTEGFTVTSLSGATTEAGAPATFTVVLNSQPTSTVTITLGNLDTSEGSLSAVTLTFATASATAPNAWNTPQIVTVTGVDDSIDDGDIPYALSLTASSADVIYNTLPVQNATVTNADNDSDGITITETAGGTTVDESGVTDTYTIVLNAAPQSGPVTVTVTPDSQVYVNSGGTTNITPIAITLTFDPALSAPTANAWNLTRTVTVTAVQDVFNETNPHTSTITHGVANYGAVTAAPITVTVVDNDPPQVPTNLGLTVGRSGTATITPAMLTVTDDVTPSAALLFTLILAPGQGDLLRTTVPLANGATFTMADITAGNLSYQNNGTPNISDGFAFKVADAIGNESGLTLFNITITGFNPPVIAFSSATAIAYTENDAATLVDISAGASDPDSVYYSTLTVDLVGGTASDLLTIRNLGTAAGQIGLSGGNVTYASTIIGTWTGGTNGTTPLVIAFGANLAGDAEVSALVSNIQFRNSSDAPTGGTRTVRFVLRDDSATENSLGFTKDVVVTPVNDAPAFVDSTLITPANVAVIGTLNVADADTYPLTLTVLTVPGKGTLSAGLTVGTPTTLASALSATTFVYTPTAGQSGTDSFTVSASDGTLTTTATITVIITGGAAARPWITSDPPAEAEAGAPLSYDILLHFSDLATSPTAGQITYALVGTLPAGVTFGGFTPNGLNANLTLSIAAGATGTIAVGVSVTVDTGGPGGQSSTLQPLTIQIVPAGSLGG